MDELTRMAPQDGRRQRETNLHCYYEIIMILLSEYETRVAETIQEAN